MQFEFQATGSSAMPLASMLLKDEHASNLKEVLTHLKVLPLF